MVLERIKEYLDYKGISVSAFERSVGMSNSSFSKSLKSGGAIGTDKLENILTKYSDLSAEWLLRGKGEMLVSNNGPITAEIQHKVQMSEQLAILLHDLLKV